LKARVLLLTPPFTQLNTPYPATAYLKGFLNTRGISACQADLGIEVTLALFSKQGLGKLFGDIEAKAPELSGNARRIMQFREDYINTIDEVVGFLQGRMPTLAQLIAGRGYLPEASRFEQMDDLQWSFGTMGIQDKAKYIATMYLEDLSDLIKETVDEHFGFSRYAEHLGRSAAQFDGLYLSLQQEYTYLDHILIDILGKKMRETDPQLVAISVPFPGNLYMSLRCGQWIRQHMPHVKVAMGGGYANTELRAVSDPRVFEFYDFITLDDGEAPIEQILRYIEGSIPATGLKRTRMSDQGKVAYFNSPGCRDYKQSETGTPDYSDLLLDKYISAIEVANPMHSLWSDGRWNKLTMAHGCYWGKCTFCDITLDYIKVYEPIAASLLADRMEEMIGQTGQHGFHFVDEAAPPSLMRALAIEIIRRKMVVSWWTNIRFEKSFTRDLCILLKRSGCIAVSGGLEVASDRLLALIDKGITVSQVAKVSRNFTEAGIMVHAYLMYGFPTQTEQETIDSLEMVRQLFATGVLKSAFWHLFTMTAHSPIGLDPGKYNVRKLSEEQGSFANNDIDHMDPSGADHEAFGYGLKKALHNYMHGACLDHPLQKWFEFKVPKTTVANDFIDSAIREAEYVPGGGQKLIWIGIMPETKTVTRSKKGKTWDMMELRFPTRTAELVIQVELPKGEWLLSILPKLHVYNKLQMTTEMVREDYESTGLEDFEIFWDNKPVSNLYKAGLLRM
jgi:radical SAM superfamily enzyme YgiQ (UPF0313 family)